MPMHFDLPPVTDVIVEGMEGITLPRMVRIRQLFDSAKIDNPSAHTSDRMDKVLQKTANFSGKRIAVTVGSRGIPHLDEIVRAICDKLKSRGAKPFLVPAMGSHGGATAEGQIRVLAGYGITEETMGVPILSSMETVEFGRLESGTRLFCDKYAFESDGIVVLNKVKPHSDFRGPYESGLAKMIAIGIAKHKGATEFHNLGFSCFKDQIPAAAEVFLEKAPVAFGVAIVQNAYDDICAVEIAPPDQLMRVDRECQALAKEKIAQLKFKELDVLVIDEIGKNFSGVGHDPNVTGRANAGDPAFDDVLKLNKLVVLGVSRESHGNGTGIARVDISTRRCLRSIDWSQVWTNMLTASLPDACKMPLYQDNDRGALRLAIRTCLGADKDNVLLARLRNTMSLDEIEVSEALWRRLKGRDDVVFVEGPYDWQFDGEGNFR